MISKKFIQKNVYFMQGIFLCSLLFFVLSSITNIASADCSCTSNPTSSLGSSDTAIRNVTSTASGAAACQSVCAKGGFGPATDSPPTPVTTTTIDQIKSGATNDPILSGQATNAPTNTATTTPANTATTANASSAASGTVSFGNPLGSITTVDGLLGSILTAARNVVVILAIIAIVIGGIMYIFAGVNEGMIKAGKAAITYALVGIAVVIAAPAFLKEIITVLGGASSGVVNTAPLSNALTFAQIGTNILNFLLSIVGILGIIGLVLGGTFYLTAAANPKQAEKGREITTYSLVGITIALAAMILVRQIAKLLTGQ